jgi:chemotaxis protein MotB
MADADTRPIIIKRIKKHAHGHHGGSWKVAYADFVTAMMAFFMLLWLLGSTTEQQRSAIQGYFQNPSMMPGSNGASSQILDMGGSVSQVGAIVGNAQQEESSESEGDINDVEAMLEQIEQEQLDALLESLEYAVTENQALKAYKDQMIFDFTEEGLRIQLIDKDDRPMFDIGSDALKPYSRTIIRELVKVIEEVPNRVSISGHTDLHPYSDNAGYTNWELSADRANAARRELLGSGMDEERVGRVVGLAASVPFDPQDPYHPSNRRISIVILNRATEDSLFGVPMAEPTPEESSLQVLSGLKDKSA